MKALVLLAMVFVSMNTLAQATEGAVDTGANSIITEKIEDLQRRQLEAQQNRITLSQVYFYGHDGGRKHRAELSYDDKSEKCTLLKSSPGFFTHDRNYSEKDVEATQCRPLVIAKTIRNRLGSCEPKVITISSASKKGKYYGYSYLNLDRDCLCTFQVEYKEWSTLLTIVNPLNSLFNGPDYKDVSDKFALNKEECASLYKSDEEKEIVKEIFDNAK